MTRIGTSVSQQVPLGVLLTPVAEIVRYATRISQRAWLSQIKIEGFMADRAYRGPRKVAYSGVQYREECKEMLSRESSGPPGARPPSHVALSLLALASLCCLFAPVTAWAG